MDTNGMDQNNLVKSSFFSSPKFHSFVTKMLTKRIFATFLGMLLLVGGVGAGVLLVLQPQLFNQKAANPYSPTDFLCGGVPAPDNLFCNSSAYPQGWQAICQDGKWTCGQKCTAGNLGTICTDGCSTGKGAYAIRTEACTIWCDSGTNGSKCTLTTKCGDGICNENASTCPQDCSTGTINCGGEQCPAQNCHCGDGQNCSYWKCEPDIRIACGNSGRSWCSNSSSNNTAGAFTCCEVGYVCNPSGTGCIPGAGTTPTPRGGVTPTPGTGTSPTPTPTFPGGSIPPTTPVPTPTPTFPGGSIPPTTPVPTKSPSPTPRPSATPVALCNSTCGTFINGNGQPYTLLCPNNLVCSAGVCRNPSCLSMANCLCPTPVPTKSPSPTPVPTKSPTPKPTASPSPSPKPTKSPSPTPVPTATPVAMCKAVTMYTPAWSLITPAIFTNLPVGGQVYFCVNGTSTGGVFDKARFTVNGVLRPEVTLRRPGTTDFCDLYTIPANVYSFSIQGEIHNTLLGWQ
jgi:hypothetical protein